MSMLRREWPVMLGVTLAGVVLFAAFTSSRVSAIETPVAQNRALLINASTDETTGNPIGPDEMMRSRESVVYVPWGTGVTAGVIEVETAHDCTYAGTWANLATVTFSGTAPKVDVVQVTGIHACIRARVSTAVADGTASASLFTN